MSNVVLVRPLTSPFRKIDSIPWGILHVGSAAKAAGYSVKLIDQIAEDDWRKTLRESLEEKPICVGISAITGRQIKYGLEISRFVKDTNPRVSVIWGGVHPSILPAETLENELVDIVIKGEGEITFLEVVKALEKGQSLGCIEGVWYKEKGSIRGNPDRDFMDLNELPDMDYSLMDIEKYIKPDESINAERAFELCTSRGCPMRCTFCYNRIYNNRWRTSSVEKILRDITRLKNEYDIDGIVWREDNFFHDRNRVETLAREMIERRLTINWSANCRVDQFMNYDSAFVGLIKESGCRNVCLGAESGSDKILGLLAKRIKKAYITESASRLKANNLKGYYQFMLGIPTEDKSDVFDTVSAICDILNVLPDARFQGPSLYTPYPGTPLYDVALRQGFRPPDDLAGWSDFEWDTLNLPWLDAGYREFLRRIRYIISPINKFGSAVNNHFKLKLKFLHKAKIALPYPELAVYNFLMKNRNI